MPRRITRIFSDPSYSEEVCDLFTLSFPPNFAVPIIKEICYNTIHSEYFKKQYKLTNLADFWDVLRDASVKDLTISSYRTQIMNFLTAHLDYEEEQELPTSETEYCDDCYTGYTATPTENPVPNPIQFPDNKYLNGMLACQLIPVCLIDYLNCCHKYEPMQKYFEKTHKAKSPQDYWNILRNADTANSSSIQKLRDRILPILQRAAYEEVIACEAEFTITEEPKKEKPDLYDRKDWKVEIKITESPFAEDLTTLSANSIFKHRKHGMKDAATQTEPEESIKETPPTGHKRFPDYTTEGTTYEGTSILPQGNVSPVACS